MPNNSGMAAKEGQEAVAAQRGHHHQRGLKKGPWTTGEDAILMEYVKKHGEGNWNAVQKNSGLARCGKSCRLRWANHLRPNLKKGSLSPDEERLIIELHAKLGNKWARMASQLPGRTDNEIKNYWNTRMKRRQRAGLPIYPHEIQQEAAVAAAFHHRHLVRHSSSSSGSSFSSLISRKPNNTACTPPHLSLYDHINTTNYGNHLQSHHNAPPSLYPMSTSQLNGGGYAMPLSAPFVTSSSSSGLFNQTLLSHHDHYPQGDFGDYNKNNNNHVSFSSIMMAASTNYPVTQMGVVPESNSELPSNQTVPNGGGGGGSGEVQMGDSGYSGLLDAVLVEAQNISNQKVKSCDDDSSYSGVSENDKSLMVEEDKSADSEEDEDEEEDEDKDTLQVESTLKNSGENSSAGNQRDDTSSPSSIGMKQSVDPLEQMDDDLLSLLNFPSTIPAVSESWYLECSPMSNRADSTSDDNVGLHIQQTAPQMTSPVKTNPTAPEVNNTLAGSCHWNNMPGIC